MSDSDAPEQLQRTIQILEAEVSLLRERNLKLETTLERQSQRHQDVERRLNLHSVSGLPTHYRMDQEVPALLEQWQSSPEVKVAFLLIQLDSKFEMIKRTLKPSVGEWVLYQIAERLRDVAGDGWLFHTRDNEFLLVRPFTSPSELHVLVRTVGAKIAEPHLFSGFNLMLGSHTGVSQYPQDGFEKSVLLHYADVALGFAQEQKQLVAIYQSDLEQQVVEKMELQNAIIKAIEAPAMREIGHQFDLFFQPKLTLKHCADGEIHVESVAVEMLMRWNHPARGSISPGRFIPVAEETGLIMPIGKWSLYEVVRRLERWKTTVLKDLEVSVNISPRQFRSSELLELLEKHVVGQPGLSEKLVLEVTETSLFEDPFVAMESLAEFKRLGLKVSVDDFGTGYSSLSHLHKFTLDEIKIDQSFVRGFPENAQDVAIIRSLASIAKELNLHLVAEGVERWEQVTELFSLGCRTIQGYLAAKPMHEKELVKFVEKLNANGGVMKLAAS
jgi:EAL domain-containing protein (putative c-di-GMP-specific phosphodiesterase class I)/GGDEF domain-containing protein